MIYTNYFRKLVFLHILFWVITLIYPVHSSGFFEHIAFSLQDNEVAPHLRPHFSIEPLFNGNGFQSVLYEKKKMNRDNAIKLWLSTKNADDYSTRELIKTLSCSEFNWVVAQGYAYRGERVRSAWTGSVYDSNRSYNLLLPFADSLIADSSPIVLSEYEKRLKIANELKIEEKNLEEEKVKFKNFNEEEATWKGQTYEELNAPFTFYRPDDEIMRRLQKMDLAKKEKEHLKHLNEQLLQEMDLAK